MKAVMVLVLCGVALAMARPQELAQYDVGAGDGAVHVVDGPVSDVNVVNGPANGDQDGHPGARSARQVDQGYYQGGQSSNPNIDISPAYVQYPNNYPGHLRPGQGHPGARSG